MDLSKYHALSDSVQDNIKGIIKTYGNKFMIINDKIELPAKIERVSLKYNTDLEYYSIMYGKPRNFWLLPFKIDFIDTHEIAINNNCYISNIHKTEEVSGTDIMHTILKMLKLLRVNTVYIHDGTTIICDEKEVDLSYYKLLEKGLTFYQKFGFKFFPEEDLAIKYKNEEIMNKALSDLLDKFRKIEISYLSKAYGEIADIINTVIQKQDYENIEILLYHSSEPYFMDDYKKSGALLNMFNMIENLFLILKAANTKYLYQTIIMIFQKSCSIYQTLLDILIHNRIYQITYHKKVIILKHVHLFEEIYKIRNSTFKLTF